METTITPAPEEVPMPPDPKHPLIGLESKVARWLLGTWRIPPSALPDVTQEVFCEALASLPSFDASRGDLVGWLYGITRNTALQYHKRYAREQATFMPLPDAPFAREVDADTRRAVREVLEAMEPARVEILWAFYVDELSHRQIASAYAVTEDTARSRLRAARKEFVELYEERRAKAKAALPRALLLPFMVSRLFRPERVRTANIPADLADRVRAGLPSMLPGEAPASGPSSIGSSIVPLPVPSPGSAERAKWFLAGKLCGAPIGAALASLLFLAHEPDPGPAVATGRVPTPGAAIAAQLPAMQLPADDSLGAGAPQEAQPPTGASGGTVAPQLPAAAAPARKSARRSAQGLERDRHAAAALLDAAMHAADLGDMPGARTALARYDELFPENPIRELRERVALRLFGASAHAP
ncbi:sigma-70 family RNA polymerase sigma factor [Polyangium aurulentum]|uniref:sigma-70 family RNA polymerase sigma factor n=1 Tax=Polyangium aurulentum TaxID=2567896 RepID=UPI0010AE61C3|nr:sigma-70 family RNA polymerase sigma factor [Polyangium aurulentum]UQA63254.1 sigma-70 family RNA polymerase sigma factor [Polyangium aurulentum]